MRLLSILTLILLPFAVCAQQESADTSKFYKDIYHYSKDRKFLYGIYKAIFNVPKIPGAEVVHKATDQRIPYRHLQGRIIRNINIISLDPFGTSITDTSKVPGSFIQKSGNALHIKTRKRVIKNYLLFAEGERLSVLKIRESERLLRSSEFIREASIMVHKTNSDSVDVTVLTRDLWTFTTSIDLSSSNIKWGVTGYNMFGIGHRLKNRIKYNYSQPNTFSPELRGSYLIPNIGKTYISSEISYLFSQKHNTKGISFERPFYSPLTKYAGGVQFMNEDLIDSLPDSDLQYFQFKYVSNIYSVWAGRSFAIKKGETIEEKSTRLVLAGAYTRTRYPTLVTTSTEINEFFQPVDLYLASIGYSNRKYYTDHFVFEPGDKEDIPSGRILQLTAGFENKSNDVRIYTGIGAGGSGYFGNSDYVSVNVEYGSFFDSNYQSTGVLKADIFAFSHLLFSGNWKLRLFGDLNFTTGINKTGVETIKLETGDWIPGYKASTPIGTSRLALNVTAVVFNSYDFLGFRFSPVIFGGIGVLGDERTSLFDAKWYKGFGGGLAFTNVYLVNSDFKLYFGYYPDIRGTQIKVSSFDAWEFNLRDYDFGKPEVVVFE